MELVKVTFTAAAVAPDCRPSLPRSGACACALPSWHPHEVVMLGGYTEERSQGDASPLPAGAASPTAPPPGPRRAPTMEAWTFSSADGGRWHRMPYAEGSPVPQPRLTCEAATVGDELWLVGGWDPSAAADAPPFLNDVWALDLRTCRWRQVQVEGEEVPRISRFAMAALPDGRLLLHTHRCLEDVLLLEPAAEAEPAAAGSQAGAAAGARQGLRPTLTRAAVHGATPGGARSPPSRGLHSLTAAAPPPPPQPPSSTVPQDRAFGPEPGLGAGSADGTALYVYGGAPQSGPMYGDLWVLDTKTMTWRELAPEGPSPQARCSHVAGAAPGAGAPVPGRYLLLLGGSYYVQPGRLQPLDDVAVYDTQTNRWVAAEVEGPRPSPRNAAVMVPLRSAAGGGGAPAVVGAADRFVLHGGWRPFVETYDDTYIATVTAGTAAVGP